MANETFLAIAIAVAITAIITAAVVKKSISKKNESENKEDSDTNFLVAAMGQFETVVTKIHTIYKNVGGIDRDTFRSDEEFRKSIITEVIDAIVEELKTININIPEEKQSLLETMAVGVIESVIDLIEKAKAEDRAASLEEKLIKYEEKEKAVAETTNVTGSAARDTVSVALGDFYHETE